jgi:hypothetical protein
LPGEEPLVAFPSKPRRSCQKQNRQERNCITRRNVDLLRLGLLHI